MTAGTAALKAMSEDDRIDMIGRSVMMRRTSIDKPPMTGFLVETNAKADRYLRKLQQRFPGIRVIDRTPIEKHILVRVAGPLR